jgi:hypothetical protein
MVNKTAKRTVAPLFYNVPVSEAYEVAAYLYTQFKYSHGYADRLSEELRILNRWKSSDLLNGNDLRRLANLDAGCVYLDENSDWFVYHYEELLDEDTA